MGSSLGSGRYLGGGNGNLLHYSCLKSSTDRGVWWATVQRAAKSPTWLSNTTEPFFFFFFLVTYTPLLVSLLVPLELYWGISLYQIHHLFLHHLILAKTGKQSVQFDMNFSKVTEYLLWCVSLLVTRKSYKNILAEEETSHDISSLKKI